MLTFHHARDNALFFHRLYDEMLPVGKNKISSYFLIG